MGLYGNVYNQSAADPDKLLADINIDQRKKDEQTARNSFKNVQYSNYLTVTYSSFKQLMAEHDEMVVKGRF